MSLKLRKVQFINETGKYYRPLVFLLAPYDQLKQDNNKCIHLEWYRRGDKWFYPWAIDMSGNKLSLSLLCILSEGHSSVQGL